MFPLPNIFVYFIKPICTITTSLTFYKLSLINIAVIIYGFAMTMWLRLLP